MPRIPQRELDELKRSVSLVALAESQGHKLRKQGCDLVLLWASVRCGGSVIICIRSGRRYRLHRSVRRCSWRWTG